MRSIRSRATVVAFVASVAVGLGSTAAAQTGFGTPEDQKNIIAGICGTQIPLNPQGCVCFAERALTELDEPQRAYLILAVIQPPAAERLDIAKSQEDLKTIFRFIESAQKGCAAPVGGQPPAGEPAPQ